MKLKLHTWNNDFIYEISNFIHQILISHNMKLTISYMKCHWHEKQFRSLTTDLWQSDCTCCNFHISFSCRTAWEWTWTKAQELYIKWIWTTKPRRLIHIDLCFLLQRSTRSPLDNSQYREHYIWIRVHYD